MLNIGSKSGVPLRLLSKNFSDLVRPQLEQQQTATKTRQFSQRVLLVQLGYNLTMTGLLIYFLTTKFKGCCTQEFTVYPVSCDLHVPNNSGFNVGMMFEVIGTVYLGLFLLAICKSVFSLCKTARTSCQKNLVVVLNVASVLSLLMFPVILFIRFMFPVQVCFCDYEKAYNSALDYYSISIQPLEPSPKNVPNPETGFTNCLFTRS